MDVNNANETKILGLKGLQFSLNSTISNNSTDHLQGQHLMSQEVGYYVVYKVIIPTVLITGITGIIITVIVLSKNTMRTSTNSYLIALAMADLIFLLILGSRLLDDLLHQSDVQVFIIYFQYAKIILNASLVASVWLTVALAAERYTAICRPLHATIICTVRRARIVICVIFILALLCRAPNFFEFQVVNYSHSNFHLDFFPWQDDETYRSVYTWLVDGIITAILPFTALSVLNILLIYELNVSHIRQNLLSFTDNRNPITREGMKTTMMLISIIIVFFILQAPYVAYNAIVAVPDLRHYANIYHPVFQIFRYVAISLIALKTTVNFALYCWFSERFWTTFKRVFCIERLTRKYRRGVRRQDSNGTVTTGLWHKYSFFASRETSV